MRMNTVEKFLVNRQAKGVANAEKIERQLSALRVGAGASALELGCGIGDVSAFLSRQLGFNVVGVDIDPAQVALARMRFGEECGLHFDVADATSLEFEAGRFDIVVAQNVFHHVPGWRRAAAEVARVLRPGGYLLWLDLTPPAPLKALLPFLKRQYGVYTLREITAAFHVAGLTEIAVRQTIPWIPIRHEMTLRKDSTPTRGLTARSQSEPVGPAL